MHALTCTAFPNASCDKTFSQVSFSTLCWWDVDEITDMFRMTEDGSSGQESASDNDEDEDKPDPGRGKGRCLSFVNEPVK